LTPGAGRDVIDGIGEGVLRARVAARPVDGAANDALRRLLAEALDVPVARITLVRGARSRTKVVAIDGVTADSVQSRWPGIEV
jgi:uncharacterized protein YggU (UPF0235/DUF167 family)